MKNSIYFLFIALALGSCTVSNKINTKQSRINRQAEANAMSSRVVSKPILADIKVADTRVKTSYKTTNQEILGLTSVTKEMAAAQSDYVKNESTNRAQFKFMEEHHCDFLVDPIYQYETDMVEGSGLVNITIEINAYPASFTKFTQPDSLPKSVFQANAFNGTRELPLITNSITKQTDKKKKEFGFISGLGFSSAPLKDYSKMGWAGNLGFYNILFLSDKIGFRTEYLLSTRGYRKDMLAYYQDLYGGTFTGEGFTKFRYTSIDFPIMMNVDINKNIRLYGGTSIGYDIIARYKEDYSIQSAGGSDFIGTDKGTNTSDVAFSVRSILGAEYVVNDKMRVGARCISPIGLQMRTLNLTFAYNF